MKKGEKRCGDYVVTLSKDVQCWFCGKVIKRGQKAVRIYCKNKTYWCNHTCEGIKEALGG
jgi:hypothetical protein